MFWIAKLEEAPGVSAVYTGPDDRRSRGHEILSSWDMAFLGCSALETFRQSGLNH